MTNLVFYSRKQIKNASFASRILFYLNATTRFIKEGGLINQNFKIVSDPFRSRQITIQIVFIIAAGILILKAVQLQLLDSKYRSETSVSAVDKFTVYPARGVMYDRADRLLVYNNPMYDLMVTYNQIEPGFDTLKFCELLGIDTIEFKEALNKDWQSGKYRKSVPFVFKSKISAKTYAAFQENLFEFPAFFVQLRNVRGYPHQNAASVLGYIREVNNEEVKTNPKVYVPGDYIGASGLEQAYEEILRGEKGARYVLKDNLGRVVDSYDNGRLDTAAVSGKDLITTLDLELQTYGEYLMQNKIGSIVAIEPKTGEILSMVTSPNYDPSLLNIDQNRNEAYRTLLNNELQPFFDRSVLAQYPPGSLFKPTVALIAMEMGILQPNRTIGCQGGYFNSGASMGCHGHPTCLNVGMAIQHSCNAYFATVFREVVDQYGFGNPQLGLDTFNHYLHQFGLGEKLGIDFPIEEQGNYPTSKYYNDYFDRQQKGQKWNSLWVISLAIGQGEMLMTNLQMANMASILANKGYYKTPHLVKKIRDSEGNEEVIAAFTEKQFVDIAPQHFDPVVDGMEMVVRAGTARSAYIPDIAICGKTGTAENNQRTGKDHSIFFAFAPKEDPKIAIAVYIENGGFGGTYAAPAASLMIEKYLEREIRTPNRKWLESYVANADLINLP